MSRTIEAYGYTLAQIRANKGVTQGRTWVSRPRELPPQPLAEPGVNLAAHRAPIVPAIPLPDPCQ